MGDNRDRGVEFGGLTDDLEDESYPMTHDELLAEYGDRELELPDETVTLSEMLQDDLDQEFEGPDDVHSWLLNMVGDGAIGRKDYTDRSGQTELDYEQESL